MWPPGDPNSFLERLQSYPRGFQRAPTVCSNLNQQVTQEPGEGALPCTRSDHPSAQPRKDLEEAGAGLQSIKLIAPNLPPPASCVCPNLSSPAVQKNVRAGNCSALCVQRPFSGGGGDTSDTTRQPPQTKNSPVVNFRWPAQACLYPPSPSLHQEPTEQTGLNLSLPFSF